MGRHTTHRRCAGLEDAVEGRVDRDGSLLLRSKDDIDMEMRVIAVYIGIDDAEDTQPKYGINLKTVSIGVYR